MTGRTACQFFDLVFLHQFEPQSELIRWRLVIHAEDIFPGANKAFRIAVALKAPVHIESVHAPCQRHLIDLTMASRTTDAFMDVNAMIEINEPWKIVNACPFDRLVCAKAFSHRRQHGTVCPDLGMTVHTGFRRGNAGEGTLLDGRMAITAVDSVVPNMVFVAEWNRLNARYPNFADVRRLIDRRQRGDDSDRQRNASENTDP